MKYTHYYTRRYSLGDKKKLHKWAIFMYLILYSVSMTSCMRILKGNEQ
jgi:hypothetical protein